MEKPQINVTNPSPQDRFKASGVRISNHRDMIAGETFQTSADAAMLQYAATLALDVRDQYSAMAAGLKLCAAHEFLQTFRLLAETPKIVERPAATVPNLNHRT